MQKRKSYAIRDLTRSQLRGNYGNAILAAIVPAIIFNIGGSLISSIFGGNFYATLVVSTITTTLTSFMVLSMTLKLAYGYRDPEFGNSLGPSDRLLSVFIYTAIIAVVTNAAQLPATYMFFGEWIVSEDMLIASIDTMEPLEALGLLYSYLGVILLATLVIALLAFKFMYTPFIVIDQGLPLKEAVNKSFQYTKGNFFRIIGFSLFFVGWYILSIFTCGILLFWVVPYHQVSLANLYLEIKKENGEPMERVNRHNTSLPIYQSPLDQTPEEQEQKDPFTY